MNSIRKNNVLLYLAVSTFFSFILICLPFEIEYNLFTASV